MKTRGNFSAPRAIFDDPLFRRRSGGHDRRSAWLDLLSEAAWQDRRVVVGGKAFDLKRGELVASLRYLEERWRWHRSSVERFLAALVKAGRIEYSTDDGIGLIRILDYEASYPRAPGLPETPTETPTETARHLKGRHKSMGYENKNEKAGHQPRHQPGQNKYKNKFKEEKGVLSNEDWPANAFEQWWEIYPHPVKRDHARARTAFAKVKASGQISFPELVRRTHAYRKEISQRPDGLFVPAAKYAAVWLEKRCYLDEPEAPPTGQPDPRSFTVDQWQPIIDAFQSGTVDWHPAWGPAPGQPGCHVPAGLLLRPAGDVCASQTVILRAKVLDRLRTCPAGSTADEIATESKCPARCVRPRLTELKNSGLILDSGRRKRSESNASATVWVLASENERPGEALDLFAWAAAVPPRSGVA